MAQQLPKIVQSASGKSYDSSSPQGKMIVNSPNYKNPFDKQSTALATTAPADTGLAAAGDLTPQMNPLESVMAVFSEMADSLASIKESAIELVMVGQADTRGDALKLKGSVQVFVYHGKNKLAGPFPSHKLAIESALELVGKNTKYSKFKR